VHSAKATNCTVKRDIKNSKQNVIVYSCNKQKMSNQLKTSASGGGSGDG
jgi:hypothetical protein